MGEPSAGSDGDEAGEPAAPGRFSYVRVLCLDAEGRLLLLRRRDPVDGHETWEPPGGPLQPGESLLQAAARELREETGIEVPLRERYVAVHRDDRWRGEPRVRDEACFFAAIGEEDVELTAEASDEAGTVVDWRLLRPADVDRLDAPVYPPDPFALLGQLLGG